MSSRPFFERNDWNGGFVSGVFLMLILVIIIIIIIITISADNTPKGFTLVKNESNDWYWLENQEYTQRQLNEYYTLKNILIQNECPDGGLIENLDGKEFLIICYEPTKVIKNIGG